MARKRYRVDAEAELELNMTSMIDIVFLLIIFFMTVTEMTKLDARAGIQLPIADQARVKKEPDPERVVISIEDKKNGSVGIYFRNVYVTPEQLRKCLHVAAQQNMDPSGKFSNREVVLRADKDVDWHNIQAVMVDCAYEKLWKLSLVARPIPR